MPSLSFCQEFDKNSVFRTTHKSFQTQGGAGLFQRKDVQFLPEWVDRALGPRCLTCAAVLPHSSQRSNGISAAVGWAGEVC